MSTSQQPRGRINHDAKVLRVPNDVLQEISTHMSENKKIAAIKVLRNATSCGLREAKEAIEKKYGSSRHASNSAAYDIAPLVTIKSITVNLGIENEDVTVDLEGLQMLTLMNMNKIGLAEVQHILDLRDLIVSWQESEPKGYEE